ncbi:MAG TPA: hypothetical protein V6D15_08065 [Oculatellaceae cyanobacterium]|jgi:hypothetical protein
MGCQWIKNLVNAVVNLVATTEQPIPKNQPIVALNTGFDEESWLAMKEKQQQIQLVQIKLQYLQQIKNHSYQIPDHKLDYPKAKQLYDFIENVQIIISLDNFELQSWYCQQERQIQEELELLRREFKDDWQPISSKIT